MFKKLKDKLAEEVKSSPQRIQLFAQAAQAAVTSASSSISDITNSDLFSIGDNDAQQSRQTRPQSSPTTQQNMFQDVSLIHSPNESTDCSHEIVDGQRQRRLSNSSFASDVSFRLPSYETPSMYHLQSDMEVSASEADDRGFSGGPATLDRVTKEQLYAAYKRTQERYKKYRTQYGDLARHYKLLERENAKARSVLVETQDKALRRISELKEQCTLEQSAKAHLEKALRVEIEERNMKIETLNTKVHLIQSNMSTDVDTTSDNSSKPNETENEVQLINLDNTSTSKPLNEDTGSDVMTLSNKIEKMEQLLNKYKESLKTSKEKNSQITTDLKMISKELESKNKQIQELNTFEGQLKEAKSKIQELNSLNEELQNQINTFDFTKTRELSTLEVDLQKANEEIAELRGIIEAFRKREEEYAISLAENKLSIHKELESKETEIKSLKDSLSARKKEIQSLQIGLDDYKKIVSVLEEEKLNNDCRELRSKISEMDTKMQELSKKNQSLEQLKTKADEEYKCLQLQLKQETAEKLAMIDRNLYLESKNSQLAEDNTKKSTIISNLESELQQLNSNKDLEKELLLKESENSQILADMMSWKEKCGKLEFEIQEEREELAKLQTEIDKLLNNHELIQAQNSEFRSKIVDLTTEYSKQQENILKYKSSLIPSIQSTLTELRELRQIVSVTSNETKRTLESNKESLLSVTEGINNVLTNSVQKLLKDIQIIKAQHDNLKLDYNKLQTEIEATATRQSEESCEISTLQNELKNLKTVLEMNKSEKNNLNDEFEKLDSEYRCAADKITLLISENNALTNKLKELEEFGHHLHVTLETERSDHLATTEKLHKCDLDNQHLNNTIQTLQTRNAMLDLEIEQLKQNHTDTLNQMARNHEGLLRMKEEELEKTSMQDNQNSSIIEQLSELQSEKEELNSQLQILENKYVGQVSEIKDLNIELKMATEKVKELSIEIFDKASVIEKLKQNQTSLEKEVAQYVAFSDSVTELENEKQELTEKLKSSEVKIKLLSEELHELKEQCKSTDNKIKEINSILINKSKECDASQLRSSVLDEKNSTLTQENLLLQSKVSDFAYNIKKLESEIDEIKVSHSEIEIEKDRLNRIIEELETKQNEHNSILKLDKECQTEKNSDKKETSEDVSAVLENKWVVEHKQSAMSSTVSLNLNKESIEDMYEQYSTLRINYDSIKDENRRLQSDIEGLQSYMTKISKENSVLNDKLRELIATSEHSADNGQLSSDDKELRNEIQRGKEKINDLQRENSLLIEENYELKDQLQSQNYSKPTETQTVSNKEKDVNLLKLKYNDLLDTTSQLETQNIELDQINKSVSGNMKQLQEKNERLKLSNEKLERRLDEALVSLRHLHSLQENTELEYLRNILYEYLTGSGTHSVTLAKVLAAIVKFDDIQTQLVLQKEKERQGFLRQLGII